MNGTRVRYPAGRRPGELTYEDYCALPARHGVPHYRVLDPEDRTLEAFELVRGAYSPAAALEGDRTFEPALFPGLAIPLAGLRR